MEFLRNEYQNIYNNNWQFMNDAYKPLDSKKRHRSEIKLIRNIENVKNNIQEKLGVIGPFVFLTNFCNNFKYPGPYNNIEKCLLLIEHLLSGYTMREMRNYIASTTFYDIYAEFYIKNRSKLEEWIDKCYQNCFTNSTVRILNANIYNPEILKHITLLMDGHHNRIVYENINFDKEDLYSYKFQNPGLNTQFVIDTNDIVVYISESLPCKINTDDNMFANNVNLKKFMHDGDCLAFDGIYNNCIDEVIEKYNNIKFNLSHENFCYPVRYCDKNKYTQDELEFNNQFSGFKSRIESFFANLGRTFGRFDPKRKIKVTDYELYNLQLKLACLFLNFKRFTDLGCIEPTYVHKLWMQSNFDYPLEIKPYVPSEIIHYKLSNIASMRKCQQNIIEKIFTGTEDIVIDEDEEINECQENIIKNEADNGPSFEVQYIIKHKLKNDKYYYFVKWRNYPKSKNSWVEEKDFNEKKIINDYWKTLKTN